jgi:transcriptional regulator with GAF, ATPase, and Fis domain
MSTPTQPSDDLLARTLVELADTLVDEFDLVALLQLLSTRSVRLFEVAAAGVMLQDAHGELQVVASSDPGARMLELLELQSKEGPCLDAFHSSTAVQASACEASGRWPVFAAQAHELGYHSFSAVPLRLRAQTIGALNLFGCTEVLLPGRELRNAQAVADIAAISVLNMRALHESRLVAEQLQYALTSRVVLEQAKGILAVKLSCDVDRAFLAMREFSRRRNLRLTDVARSVVGNDLDPSHFRGKVREPAPPT